MDKLKLEERLKRVEEHSAEIEDSNERLIKERKQLEDRVKQLSDQLVEEEEKAKQISKMRAKADGQLVEYEEDLERERNVRLAMEREKSRLEQVCSFQTHSL